MGGLNKDRIKIEGIYRKHKACTDAVFKHSLQIDIIYESITSYLGISSYFLFQVSTYIRYQNLRIALTLVRDDVNCVNNKRDPGMKIILVKVCDKLVLVEHTLQCIVFIFLTALHTPIGTQRIPQFTLFSNKGLSSEKKERFPHSGCYSFWFDMH